MRPTFPLSVVMERITTHNRWQSETWQLAGLLPPMEGDAAQVLIDREGLKQVRHPGLAIELFKDEGEGYYLNLVSPAPCVFVAWRLDEASGEAIPKFVTVSYNEAARWMDAQEKVESVPMPDDVEAALRAWVEANYQPPQKKQRIRPNSFQSREGRYKGDLK